MDSACDGGGGALGAGGGDGEGDEELFRRLRRRADRASSGAGCCGGFGRDGLRVLGQYVCGGRGRFISHLETLREMLDFLRAFNRSSRCWS